MSARRPNRFLREFPPPQSIFAKQLTHLQLYSQPDNARVRLASAVDDTTDCLGTLNPAERLALAAQRDAFYSDLMRADGEVGAREGDWDGDYDVSDDGFWDDYNYSSEENAEDEDQAGLGEEYDDDADDADDDSAVSDLTPTPTSPTTLAALTLSQTHLDIPHDMFNALRGSPRELGLDGREAEEDEDAEVEASADANANHQGPEDLTPTQIQPSANANAVPFTPL